MENQLENFYLTQEEPNKSCFLYLRNLILSIDDKLSTNWRYKLPFFDYKGKMFCYMWKNKKTNMPYICFCKGNEMSHPKLIQGDRKKMKAYYINPNEDIDIEELKGIILDAIKLFK